MAMHVSSLAKRVASAHVGARRKTTKRRPSKRGGPSKKREESTADIPHTSNSVLDVGTEFSYNISLSFIANMTGLPYLVVSEKQIRDRLKKELKTALVDAIDTTSKSFDMQKAGVVLTGVNIESAVNSG